jgi:hypothetical protein
MLITEEEGRNTIACNGMYVVMPALSWWERQNYKTGQKLPEGFAYSSDKNNEWLSVEDLEKIILQSNSPEEQAALRLMTTIHQINEKVVIDLINSEEFHYNAGPSNQA